MIKFKIKKSPGLSGRQSKKNRTIPFACLALLTFMVYSTSAISGAIVCGWKGNPRSCAWANFTCEQLAPYQPAGFTCKNHINTALKQSSRLIMNADGSVSISDQGNIAYDGMLSEKLKDLSKKQQLPLMNSNSTAGSFPGNRDQKKIGGPVQPEPTNPAGSAGAVLVKPCEQGEHPPCGEWDGRFPKLPK